MDLVEPGAAEDRRLAENYFDEHQVKLLIGVPEDAIAHLRARYIEDVLANPEAVRQLREGAA